MSDEIENYVNELQQTVIVAELNYEIWWVYKGTDTRPKYVDAMSRYATFFKMSLHAHFVALLVALYRLYETRKDTYNIPSLLNKLKRQKAIDESVLKSLEKTYSDEAKPLWVKVNMLRNKAFGHRSRARTVKEVFKEAGVTPNDLKALVEVTKKLLNQLTLAWKNSTHLFNLGAEHDTLRLLDDLNSFQTGLTNKD